MLVYAGIDEAGYGPLLGPLCIACAGFILPDDDPEHGAPDLWKRLRRVACRAGTKGTDGRIAIDDSKKLKGANGGSTHPLRKLERGVLSFCAPASPPQDDDAFFRSLGVLPPAQPWYGSTTALPVAHSADELRIVGARLARGLAASGMQLGLLAAEAIDPSDFNDQVERMGSKALVNFCAVMRLVDRVWRAWPDAHPRIVIDRQGGRTHYREALQLSYPEARLTVLAEEEAISRYRLEDRGSALTVTFTTEAERKHLPVALASMTAKYVRELLMLRLNRFFAGRLPELKPTAGYVEDGHRFLRDVQPVLDLLRIEPGCFVRRV